jgi:type I restriction enzyme S subunit
MKHLFTYGPVPPEETENVPLKETEIGKVPEEWEVVKLGEVADSFTGGGTPSTDVNEYWSGDIHWTTSKNINSLYLLCGEKKITEKGLRESSTHLIPKYNLIIGTRVGVGKVAINKVDIAISQDLTGVFIDKEKYSLEYLAFLIYTDKVQNYFKECTRGTTIKGIPRDDLKKLPLQIPPLPVQQKIASILSAIDAKIEAEENKKQALEELSKTLLHNLMTAKIRVNQLEINL